MSAAPGTDTTDRLAAGLREAFAHYPTGIAVTTTNHPDGTPHGLTVSSLVSHSIAPPTVSFNVAIGSRSHRLLRANDHLAVNLLAAGQEALARRFASNVDDRFADVPWHRGPHQVPVLHGALAVLTCRRAATFNHGDHTIILGELVDASVHDRRPLVYHRRDYRVLGTHATSRTVRRSSTPPQA